MGLFVFLLLTFKRFLKNIYSGYKSLSIYMIANSFSYSFLFLFAFLMVSFEAQNILIMEIHFFLFYLPSFFSFRSFPFSFFLSLSLSLSFSFCVCAVTIISKKCLPTWRLWRSTPMFSSKIVFKKSFSSYI